MLKKIRTSHKTRIFKVLVVCIVFILFVKVLDYCGSSDSPPDYPDYEMIKLETMVDWEEVYKGELDEQTEQILFLQTGLGEKGIENLQKQCTNTKEFQNKLLEYQQQLFHGTGKKNLVSLKKGDVLVSMSQRLCYYPHGHAAIVVDEKEEILLEAKSYKAGSCMCRKDKWSNLSSVVVLRLKEEIVSEFEEAEHKNPANCAADYAIENLDGLKYSLFKDLRPLSGTTPEYTQCAHLVWYAYYASGLDIDENRGLIIKPKDFLKSDVFEVIQVFGINPKDLLKMRNE